MEQHTVESSPAAAFNRKHVSKFMKDIEETTSKGDGESNVRIDKKIDKMQQDLGDFIDELESGNMLVMKMNLQRMKRLEVNSIDLAPKTNTDFLPRFPR